MKMPSCRVPKLPDWVHTTSLAVPSWTRSTHRRLIYNVQPVLRLSSRAGSARLNSGRAVIYCHNFHTARACQLNIVNGAVHQCKDAAPKSRPLEPPMDKLCIVFTDIVRSTELWEKNPKAMAAAMETHDNAIRSLTERHQGYEVKQNGDGFMIAFPTALCALQFCLDAQEQLLEQTWPEDLLETSPGKEVSDDGGTILYRGLRIRTSAHWGSPVCVWNNVIKRMDYLGPMVNRAARFIEVTEGGQIVVSEEFLLEVQKAKRGVSSDIGQTESVLDLAGLQNQDGENVISDDQFEIRFLGEHQFKGLSESKKLYFIIPHSLHGRLDSWPKHKYVAGSKGNIIPGLS